MKGLGAAPSYRAMDRAAVAMVRTADGVADAVDELGFAADDVHHQPPRVDDRLARPCETGGCAVRRRALTAA